MSWASRRQTIYSAGVGVFFLVVFGIPLALFLYKQPSCFDGKQNQGETAIDKGGPCALLDERTLSPSSVLWSRAFLLRGGTYSAIAYIENPNRDVGVRRVNYRFGLYDENNVLVAERTGTTFVMPSGITPVFEGGITTGSRVVARTYFAFTAPLVWERMADVSHVLSIGNKRISAVESAPRLEAEVTNSSVAPILNARFVAVVFDPAGNAFAASATELARLAPAEKGSVIFTWPDPFRKPVGRIDVLPVLPPLVQR